MKDVETPVAKDTECCYAIRRGRKTDTAVGTHDEVCLFMSSDFSNSQRFDRIQVSDSLTGPESGQKAAIVVNKSKTMGTDEVRRIHVYSYTCLYV